MIERSKNNTIIKRNGKGNVVIKLWCEKVYPHGQYDLVCYVGFKPSVTGKGLVKFRASFNKIKHHVNIVGMIQSIRGNYTLFSK